MIRSVRNARFISTQSRQQILPDYEDYSTGSSFL